MMLSPWIAVPLAFLFNTIPVVDLQTASLPSLTYGYTKYFPQPELTQLFECLCKPAAKICGMSFDNDTLYGIENLGNDQTFSNSTNKVFTCDLPPENSTKATACLRYNEEKPREKTFYINIHTGSSCNITSCCLTLQWAFNVSLNNFPTVEFCEKNASTSKDSESPACTTVSETIQTTNVPDAGSTTDHYVLNSTANSSITVSETYIPQDVSGDESTLILTASIAGGALVIAIVFLVIGICLYRRRRRKRLNSNHRPQSFILDNHTIEYSEIGDIKPRTSDKGRTVLTTREQNTYEKEHSPYNPPLNFSNASDFAIPISGDSSQCNESKYLHNGQANEYEDPNEICSKENAVTELHASSNPHSSYETIDNVQGLLSALEIKQRSNHIPLTHRANYEDVDFDNIDLQGTVISNSGAGGSLENVHSSDQSLKENVFVGDDYDQIEKHSDVADSILNTYNKGSQPLGESNDRGSSEDIREGSEANEYNKLTSSKKISRREGITDSFLETYGPSSGTPRDQSDTGKVDEDKTNKNYKVSTSKRVNRREGITDRFLETYGRGSGQSRNQSGTSREGITDRFLETYGRGSGQSRNQTGTSREGITDSFLETYGRGSGQSRNQTGTSREGITDRFLETYGRGSGQSRNQTGTSREGITDSFLETYGRGSGQSRNQTGTSREGITDRFLETYGRGSGQSRNQTGTSREGITDSFLETYGRGSGQSRNQTGTSREGITDSFLETYGRGSGQSRNQSGTSEIEADKTKEYCKLGTSKRVSDLEDISDSCQGTYGPASGRPIHHDVAANDDLNESEIVTEELKGNKAQVTNTEMVINDLDKARDNLADSLVSPPSAINTTLTSGVGTVVENKNSLTDNLNVIDVKSDDKSVHSINFLSDNNCEEFNKSKLYYEVEPEPKIEYV